MRHGGQIADQVLHQLRELHLHAGDQALDLCPYVRHDVGRGASVLRLQTHEEVPVVRLGEGASETHAGAPREGVHFRHTAQDRLHLRQLALGFTKRGSGPGKEVQYEATLVDIGHEAARHLGIRDTAYQQQWHQRRDQQGRPAEQSSQPARVLAGEPACTSSIGIVPVPEIDEAACQHRYDERGHQIRNDQRDSHCDRQRLGESTGDATEETQRQEHDQRGKAGPGQRPHEFARRRQNRFAAVGHRRCAGTARDVLNHDDGIVDHQSYRGGDPAERHDVEAHAEHIQQQHARGQRSRHHQRGDQHHAHVAQEQDQHHAGQHQADQHRVADADSRLHDELALVVPLGELHAGRQLESAQAALHFRCNLQCVAVWLLIDIEKSSGLAVFDYAGPLWDDAVAHLCDVTQTHHAAGTGLHYQLLERVELPQVAVGNYQVEFVVVLHTADRLQRISGGNCGDQVAEAQSVRVKTMWVGQHLDFGYRAALHGHTCQAGHRGEQRHDLKLGQIVERCLRHGVRGQRVGDDREHRRVHAPNVETGAGRQARENLSDGRIDQQRGGDHVAAPAEVDGDLRRAARSGRAHFEHSRHRTDRLLHRPGHAQSGLVNGAVAG